MLSRVNTLFNVGYGIELDNDLRSSLENHEQSSFTNGETWAKPNLRSSFANLQKTVHEEYMNHCSCEFVNEEMAIFN